MATCSLSDVIIYQSFVNWGVLRMQVKYHSQAVGHREICDETAVHKYAMSLTSCWP